MTLSHYDIANGSDIQLMLGLAGGVGVIKKHLKTLEAVRELKARVVQSLKGAHVDMDERLASDAFKTMVEDEDFQK